MSSRSNDGPVRRSPTSLPEIRFSQTYLEQLRRFIQPKQILIQNGYVMNSLSETEIEKKRRCDKCGKYLQKGRSRYQIEKDKEKEKTKSAAKLSVDSTSPSSLHPTIADLPAESQSENLFDESKRLNLGNSEDSTVSSLAEKDKNQPQTFHCKFHDGFVHKKYWSCCNQHKYSKGCKQAENHISRNYRKGELEAFWKYHSTPYAASGSTPRYAVAIDCEMGVNIHGETELIRVTAIDYFTSEILVNQLVYPDVPMADYSTRFSGVSALQMENARRSRTCIFGKSAARETLWRFIGPQTIVVGHSANNDLNALRWIHLPVIDTMLVDYLIHAKAQRIAEEKQKAKDAKNGLISAEGKKKERSEHSKETAVDKPSLEKQKRKSKGSGQFSLKTLTKIRIGKNIQQGRDGHDSLEDAIATRDLAHWNVIVRGFDELSIL